MKVTEGMRRRGLWRNAKFEITRVLTNWRKKLEMIGSLENAPVREV